jgi:hypothetical protein
MDVSMFVDGKVSVVSDWASSGPTLSIEGLPDESIVLLFKDDDTMHRFGMAVLTLCRQPSEPGLVKVCKVKLPKADTCP